MRKHLGLFLAVFLAACSTSDGDDGEITLASCSNGDQRTTQRSSPSDAARNKRHSRSGSNKDHAAVVPLGRNVAHRVMACNARRTDGNTSAGYWIFESVHPGVGFTIVDGFAVAEDIRHEAPDDFELLSTVPVKFVHRRATAVAQGDDVHLVASAPIIAVDRGGHPCGVRFHERAMNVLPIEADVAELYYPALRRFARAVRGDAYRWRHGLQAGEAVVYDNQRVLHGREGFAGSPSRRHLRLCTIDRDQVHSRLRRLRERFGTGTEGHPLPSGNLS